MIVGAAAQAGVRGLSTLNDHDGHWENVGWAVTPAVDPLPPPQENPGEPAPEPEQPVSQPRNDDDEDEPVDSRLDDDFDEWTAAEVQSGNSLSAAAPAVHFGVLWVAALFVFIYQVEGHVVVPNVMASALRLHPLLVIFGLLAGGALYGIPGVLVALDGATFRPVSSKDGLLDTAHEAFEVELGPLPAGRHVAALRATDAARNSSTSSVEFAVP